MPQFIERETKIVGPLTFKQFGFIGGAGAVIFILYFFVKIPLLFIPLALAVAGIGLTLAFVKIGAKTFPEFLLSMLQFTAGPKTYIWRKGQLAQSQQQKQQAKIIPPKKDEAPEKPKFNLTTKSKLQDLSTKVTTQE